MILIKQSKYKFYIHLTLHIDKIYLKRLFSSEYRMGLDTILLNIYRHSKSEISRVLVTRKTTFVSVLSVKNSGKV